MPDTPLEKLERAMRRLERHVAELEQQATENGESENATGR